MSSVKHDPLEAAKLNPKGPKKAPPPPAPEPVVAKAVEPAEPPPPAAPSARYKVTARKRISWRGCITWLDAGAIIDPRGYGGEDGMVKLRAQGVEMEPVE